MIHSKLCSQGGLARRIEQVSAMNPSCWWPTLRVTWRNGSEPYVESYGLHLEEVKFSQQNFKGKLNPFKKALIWMLKCLCDVRLQESSGSTSRRQCCMKPSVAISDWYRCSLNSVWVSFESTGSKRRDCSGLQGRPTMSESCRMRLTVARSRCLTGGTVGGGGFPSSFKLKSVLHGIHDVPSLTVPQTSTQWHRC